MNNKTIHEFTIKLRGDNVYDLYVDDQWVASRGHYEKILDEVRDALKYLDNSEQKELKIVNKM